MLSNRLANSDSSAVVRTIDFVKFFKEGCQWNGQQLPTSFLSKEHKHTGDIAKCSLIVSFFSTTPLKAFRSYYSDSMQSLPVTP